jgi:hypothetical protein
MSTNGPPLRLISMTPPSKNGAAPPVVSKLNR